MEAAGRHVDELRLYRWRQHHMDDGHDAEREAAEADLARQITAADWEEVRDGRTGTGAGSAGSRSEVERRGGCRLRQGGHRPTPSPTPW